MSEPLLAPTFLFRFSTPCRYQQNIWSGKGVELSPAYTLPSFGELEKRPMFADLRAAWSEDGLSFAVRVTGKKQPPWCRASRVEDSDGLRIWIDTRDTHNIHRASRFCHEFLFMPQGGGIRLDQPVATMLPVNRARENPKPIAEKVLKIHSEKRIDGYIMQAHIPAAAMTGFDSDEHLKLGFSYAVVDRELGWQTFTVGPEFPFVEDPSLWGTLELTK